MRHYPTSCTQCLILSTDFGGDNRAISLAGRDTSTSTAWFLCGPRPKRCKPFKASGAYGMNAGVCDRIVAFAAVAGDVCRDATENLTLPYPAEKVG